MAIGVPVTRRWCSPRRTWEAPISSSACRASGAGTVVKTGFLSVALFASLLGVTTIIHWDTFNHRHVAFWLWAGLYFITPLLVFGGWLANRRFAAPSDADEPRLGDVVQWIVGLIGLLALLEGNVMFLEPTQVIAIWSWTLTPLTCRVVGAIFCLDSAGIGALVDPRWTTVKLTLEVEVLMVALMLIAVACAGRVRHGPAGHLADARRLPRRTAWTRVSLVHHGDPGSAYQGLKTAVAASTRGRTRKGL